MLCDLNCTNLKCIATGECVDIAPLPFAESPSLVPTTVEVNEFTISGPVDDAMFKLSAGGHVVPAHQRIIIAFTGLAGSGKSTAAMHLVEHRGFARVRFAGPLKAMMAALGCTPEEIDGDRKEVPCDLLGGRTPRHAMQTLGTEWGRDMIASDLWIRAWQAAVAKVPAGQPIVVDDCRFPNEADAVRAAGGALIRVVRPGAGAGAAGHSSEGYNLPAIAEIMNDRSASEFKVTIDSLFRDWSWADHAPA